MPQQRSGTKEAANTEATSEMGTMPKVVQAVVAAGVAAAGGAAPVGETVTVTAAVAAGALLAKFNYHAGNEGRSPGENLRIGAGSPVPIATLIATYAAVPITGWLPEPRADRAF